MDPILTYIALNSFKLYTLAGLIYMLISVERLAAEKRKDEKKFFEKLDLDKLDRTMPFLDRDTIINLMSLISVIIVPLFWPRFVYKAIKKSFSKK